MKLCMFSPKGLDLDRGWPGRIDGDRVIQLAAQTLQAFFTGGGSAREHAEFLLADVELRAPVAYPPSVRVFEPGEAPSFEFRAPYPVRGPEAEVVLPRQSTDMGCKPAVAAIIGADGQIGGFTLAAEWIALDLRRSERERSLGPSKSSDFAFSLGPVVVTADEGIPEIVTCRVGEHEHLIEVSSARAWPSLLAHAAENTALAPGDVLLGSSWLRDVASVVSGQTVEVEASELGCLRTRLV